MLCTDIRRWFRVGKNELRSPRHDVVNIKVNSTVKKMSKRSINADTRQDVDSKYPSTWKKYKN